MRFRSRTHLEWLIDWSSDACLRVGPDRLHRRWMSMLLPTRRFGPDAWVGFQMASEPLNPDLGGFRAWVLFDAHSVRLLGYLEPPLIESFGVIPPFRKPSSELGPELVPALGEAGERFFSDATDAAEADEVLDALQALDEGHLEALRITAPDFFGWMGR